jgi:hypothetical protein
MGGSGDVVAATSEPARTSALRMLLVATRAAQVVVTDHRGTATASFLAHRLHLLANAVEGKMPMKVSSVPITGLPRSKNDQASAALATRCSFGTECVSEMQGATKWPMCCCMTTRPGSRRNSIYSCYLRSMPIVASSVTLHPAPRPFASFVRKR